MLDSLTDIIEDLVKDKSVGDAEESELVFLIKREKFNDCVFVGGHRR